MRPRAAIIEPGPGRESVWAYPRPPAVVPTRRHVLIVHGGRVIADTRDALRVLETSHAPTWYLPVSDVRMDLLHSSGGRGTTCEWKGGAAYLDLVVADAIVPRAAWRYDSPLPGFETIRDRVAFYARGLDNVTVDGERVRPQPGGFYGGWVTDDVVGPFKGEPGTGGW